MSNVRILITFFCLLFLIQGLHAQKHESDTMMDLLDLIRTEKFDLILPQAMRENKIDMWIHVMRAGNPDSLRLDLGSEDGYFIFTDRGGDRIERAVFGSNSDTVRNCGAYDIISGEAPELDFISRFKGLREFVAKRDPKRIAVNFSEWLAVSDGISHTDYLKLAKALGDRYAKRMVSAENLITDFRSRRVMAEIVFYGQLCKITTEIIERAFELIKPGVTTLRDVSLWLRDQTIARGFGSVIRFEGPGVSSRDPEGHAHSWDDHLIQRGELVHIDLYSVTMMNYRTDIKRIAYVLREGETAVPPEIQKAFDQGLEVRKVFRKNIKVGRTAGETLEILIRKLEEAGFVYTDKDRNNRNVDPKKTRVHIDFHCLGHLGGNEAVGPRISPLGPDRAHLKIPLYHLFVLEYGILLPVPEWGEGKQINLAIEDDVIVTERGVEFLYPPIHQIRVIR